MISFRKKETGVLVLGLSEHLWADDLEVAIPMVCEAARSRLNPLLLIVEVSTDFDMPAWSVLSEILQPGILVDNRPSRVAVLTPIVEERESENPSEGKTGLQIRYFSPDQGAEAEAWLLSLPTLNSLPPILG